MSARAVKIPQILWSDDFGPSELEAAENFLTLIYPPKRIGRLVQALGDAKCTTRRADDILRAARMDPVPPKDPRVQKQIEKLNAGKQLKPVLVVCTKRGTHVANGVHRLSLAFHVEPATQVPVAIAHD